MRIALPLLALAACSGASAPITQRIEEFPAPGQPAELVLMSVSFAGGGITGQAIALDSATASIRSWRNCRAEYPLSASAFQAVCSGPNDLLSLTDDARNTLFAQATSRAFRDAAEHIVPARGDGLTVSRFTLTVTASETRFVVNVDGVLPSSVATLICQLQRSALQATSCPLR